MEDQTLNAKIKVKAVDKAGNEYVAEYVPPEKPKSFPYWIIILIILTVIGLMLPKLKKYYKKLLHDKFAKKNHHQKNKC